MKIAILSPSKARLDDFNRLEALAGKAHDISRYSGGTDQMMKIAETSSPDLIVVDNLCSSQANFSDIERVSLRFPIISFILLCEESSPELLLTAMRIGVRQVLPTAVPAEELLHVINRIGRSIFRKEAQGPLGKVMAFMPCKGGSGSTFLSTNLGYVLASSFSVSVSLIDLHPQFGDALLFVSDQAPGNTLPDVVRDISRLDASLLIASMVHVLPNYSILAGSESPERSTEVKPDDIDTLLNLAKSQFDFTILDLGLQLNSISIRALDHADLIFLVMQESLPHIRSAKQMIGVLRSLGYGRDKTRLIVNRYEGKTSIRLSDIEQTLEMDVFRTCPNSFETVSESVNQGMPILKINSHDVVSKCLVEIGKQLVPKKEPQEADKSGWFTRLLKPG